jgi:hypothetical protein
MDKLLAHLDIAQEEGIGNPDAAHSRFKAKTNGQLVSRSPAGVESALGGSLSIQSSVVNAGTAGAGTLVPIPGLAQITVPPGKTAHIVLIGYTAGAISDANTAIGLRFSQPAGADGGISGSAEGKITRSAAAADSVNFRADVVNVAAGVTSDFVVTVANTATGKVPGNVSSTIRNNSSNVTAVVIGLIDAISTTDISGTSIFALIT